MPVMRRNYDKPHRCRGWSGPALKAGRIDGIDGDKCGYLAPRRLTEYRVRNGPDSWNSYGLVRCPGCKTWVLPYWMRYVDPTYLTWKVRRAIKEARRE